MDIAKAIQNPTPAPLAPSTLHSASRAASILWKSTSPRTPLAIQAASPHFPQVHLKEMILGAVLCAWMNTAEIHVGRLVEIRVASGYRSVADVDALFTAIAKAIHGKRYKRFVLVADWRGCTLMSSDAAHRALERMTRNNEFVERSGVLSSPRSPTAVLQFLRVVRESNHAKRRLFQEAAPLAAWLAEVLTAEEIARLHLFLDAGSP